MYKRQGYSTEIGITLTGNRQGVGGNAPVQAFDELRPVSRLGEDQRRQALRLVGRVSSYGLLRDRVPAMSATRARRGLTSQFLCWGSIPHFLTWAVRTVFLVWDFSIGKCFLNTWFGTYISICYVSLTSSMNYIIIFLNRAHNLIFIENFIILESKW